MKNVVGKDGKCTSCSCGGACEGCVEACSLGALKRGDVVVIFPEKCIECGMCVEACDKGAISIEN